MAAILVDYENVSMTDGLKGVEFLNENDILIIFFSQSCEKIRADYIEKIERSHCEFKVYKLVHIGKNALDFYIAVECGVLISNGEKQICIVSRDKGFGAISDYIGIKDETEDVTVRFASNIENAIMTLNDPEGVFRRRLLKQKTRTLSIEAESARIQEHRAVIERIMQVLKGTEYEQKTNEILNFIEKQDMKMPKSLYIGSLHEFGRKDGCAIYQIIRNVACL